MNIEELNTKLTDIDSLWNTSHGEIDVQLDPSVNSIIVTRHVYDYGSDVNSDPRSSWSADCEAYSASMPMSDGYDGVRISGQMRSPFQRVEPVMEISLSGIELSEEIVHQRMTLIRDPGQFDHLPEVKLIGLGPTGIYEVAEDYSFDIDYESIGRPVPAEIRKECRDNGNASPRLCTLTVKKGFQFDRATIPRVFWVLVSKDDLSNVPPLLHDVLYRFNGALPRGWVEPYVRFTREEADNLFYHLMRRSGVASWRLHIVYQAVCYFSSFAWGRQRHPH